MGATSSGIRGPVALVGLGLMGGSLARALRAGQPEVEILGVDPDSRTGARALDEGVIDRFDAGGEGLLPDAATVVYAGPLRAMFGVMEDHAPRIAPDALVTDLVSLNAPVLERARALGLADRFISAHPMCGSEASGYGASDGALYQGATIHLSADPETRESRGGEGVAFWSSVGGVPDWIDAREHDRTMAWVSHLPQLVSNALAGALHAAGIQPGQLGPGARQMTRLAGSSPEMWKDLLDASAPVTGTGLTSVARGLQVVADLLARRDLDRIVEFMELTREWRTGEAETGGVPGERREHAP